MILDTRDFETDLARRAPATGPPTSAAEQFGADFEATTRTMAKLGAMRLATDRIRAADEINAFVRDRVGTTLPNPYAQAREPVVLVGPGAPPFDPDRAVRDYWRKVEGLRRQHPDLAAVVPDQGGFEHVLAGTVAGAEERAGALRTRAGTAAQVAGFVGGMAGATLDPINLVTLPLGAAAGSTFLQRILINAAINTGVEVVQQPMEQKFRKSVGLDYGLARGAANVGMVAAGSLVLGGAMEGLGALVARAAPEARARAAAVARMTPEELADAAERGGFADDPDVRAAVDLIRDHAEVEKANPFTPADGRMKPRAAGDAGEVRPVPHAAAEAEHRARLAEAERAALAGEAPRIEDPAAVRRDPSLGFEVGLYDPASVVIDAKRMQFKTGADPEGWTGALEGVETWDPMAALAVTLWEPRSGPMLVADGHQRVGLARRLKARGLVDKNGNPIMVPAVVLREADGWTALDARLDAALTNIKKGTVSPDDVRVAWRELGEEFPFDEIPKTSAVVRDGLGLARLGDDAYAAYRTSNLDARFAAVVGREIDAPEAQFAAMRALIEDAPKSMEQAEFMVRDMASAGFAPKRAREGEQLGLFADAKVVALAKLRHDVMAAARKILGTEAAALELTVRRKDLIAEVGGLIDAARTKDRVFTDREVGQLLESLNRIPGPVRDAVDAAARALDERPKDVKPIARDLIDAIRRDRESIARSVTALPPEVRGAEPGRGAAPSGRDRLATPGQGGPAQKSGPSSPDLASRAQAPRPPLPPPPPTRDEIRAALREFDADPERAIAAAEARVREGLAADPKAGEKVWPFARVDDAGNVVPDEMSVRKALDLNKRDAEAAAAVLGCVKGGA